MQPDPTVAEAEQEAREAQQLLDTLAEKVRNGDESITVDQLTTQKELAAFAALRVEAAKRRHQGAQAADRARTATAAADAARGLLEPASIAPVLDAVTNAAAAIAALIAAVDARNARLAEAGATLRDINAEMVEAGANGPWPTAEYGARGDERSVTVLGRGHVHRLSPGQLAAAALLTGLHDAAEPAEAERQAREFLGGLTDAQVRKLGEDLPGLADAWRLTPEQWTTTNERQRYRAHAQGRNPQTGQAA